ncbi:MAG TPA: hypothetical protein DIS90_02860 [Cytophagales bacterium]|nr:hypothetical protein [Cytophagales bacterium]
MQRLRLWIRNVFGFSRSETNGFLILLPTMVLILFSYPVYKSFFYNSPILVDKDQGRIDSLIAQWNFTPVTPPSEEITNTLFPFDPNSASLADFDSLGVPPYLSQRINNYRNKGGRFRNAGDLLKIYGMDSSLYARLAPYIIIYEQKRTEERFPKSNMKDKKEVNSFALLDLNLADTTQLKAIRGIGTVLANRIIKYRNALGGFVSDSQMKEVYGLDSTVVMAIRTRFFIAPNFRPLQLDLNKASTQELSAHPYIRQKIAKTIVTYRFQHGSFNEIDDLLKIDLIDSSTFIRMRPYLKLEH